ncbi:hypothetical protein RCH23_001008 [Cryobacterium sp. CAN_C3]|nr:hypothetical protein [Cryobacterium sp. CAN_C3]
MGYRSVLRTMRMLSLSSSVNHRIANRQIKEGLSSRAVRLTVGGKRRAMMNRTTTALRLVVAGLILAAVISTAADVASRVPLNPFNFFGLCTV